MIYFGCRTNDLLFKLVMKVLQGRNLKYYKMRLKKDSCSLERVIIEDKYAGMAYGKGMIATVDKGIPYIYEGGKKYEDYFLKAIDIVRKFPDSKSIIDVELSVNKGDRINPVVFVQYK